MNTSISINEIKKVQKQILIGLREIKRICEKYNLKFYLVGESALGAIRHSGFIPWDDDADVGMPRKDYDAFMRICETELGYGFFLQTTESDKGYYLPYAKLRIENTKYILQSSKNFDMHHGIFIDIYPLDCISGNKFKAFRQKHIVDFFTKIRNTKIHNPNPGTTKYYLRKILSSMFSIRFVNKIITNEITLAQNERTNRTGNLLGLYGFNKEVFRNEIFGIPHFVKFEDELFPIPNQYGFFLSQIYGDYMTIPNVEKQINHKAILVEINNE